MNGKYAVFATPEDAAVALTTDGGKTFVGAPGSVAGRPALVCTITDVPDGHGARLVINKAGFVPENLHGTLWLSRVGPHGFASFDVDDVTLASGGSAAPVVGISRLHTDGEAFLREDGARWYWKGATDFRLLQRFLAGEDLTPLLRQRKAAGANLVRVVAMKANNTGWELLPNYNFNDLEEFWNLLEVEGLYTEHTVMCDTRVLLANQSQQQLFWGSTIDRAVQHPNVLLELINEAGHSTQACDPAAFPRPSILASHGSGGTDETPVKPLWDFATYHARREAPPDSRGMSNYDVYAFESSVSAGVNGWPKPCPFIPDEGMKPQDYGFDPAAAAMLGRHCALHAGGTFHTDIGSDLWDAPTEACARAFFAAIQ